MSKYIPDEIIDEGLNIIADADGESICSVQPTTYFQACRPDMWIQNTEYALGSVVAPPTDNGFVYEATVGGTAGATEPGWTTTQDSTFSDGTVTWKAHNNYSLAYTALSPSDKVLSQSTDPAGRKLTIAQKIGVVTHRSGTVTHAAIFNHALKKIRAVSIASTTLLVDDNVESGRTTIIFSFSVIGKYPVA